MKPEIDKYSENVPKSPIRYGKILTFHEGVVSESSSLSPSENCLSWSQRLPNSLNQRNY